MRKPVKIGDLFFDTSKSCVSFVREKLNEIGFVDIDIKSPYYMFLLNLVQNHPNRLTKIGCGIKTFHIRPNILQKNGKHLTITRYDETEDCISWRECSGAYINKNNNSDIPSLLREIISPVMIQYKYKNCICEMCGSKNKPDLHVHHELPFFQTIISDFIKINDIHPTYHIDINTGLRIVDGKDLINNFTNYHNSVCNLKVLCQGCHILHHKNYAINNK